MNLLLLEPEEVGPGGRVRLVDRRAEHLIRVLNVGVRQTVRAGIVRGPLARATVVSIGSVVELELELGEEQAAPTTDLVLAMPRPKALPRILQAAASFGIRRIDIINTWRVDASYFSSHKLTLQALELDVRLGCEQGRQTYVPAVQVHRLFVPYVDEVLRVRLAADVSCRLLIAEPTASQLVEHVVVAGAAPDVALAVGPDGGFLEREIASLVGIGGTAVSFGQAVLRSETAVVAILSQLDLLKRLSRGAGLGS